MLKRPSTGSRRSLRYTTHRIEPMVEYEDGLHNRQGLVPHFNQESLGAATVALIAAGGLGSEGGEGLARKGVGTLKIFDPDHVELSKLNRQRFYKKDLYRNKAMALSRNLVAEATDDSLIIEHPYSFEHALRRNVDMDADVIVCGADNNPTKLKVSAYYLGKRPVVFLGVDELADHGYVFVQDIEGPCFACLFPHALNDEGGECAKVGAVKDILKVVAGIALYAIDSLLMRRPRSWNFREVTLGGFCPDATEKISTRGGCLVCGGTYGV